MLWAPIGMPALQKDDAGSEDRWGGLHVSMVMTTEGATLEFDCAHGAISKPIKPNAHGEFSVAGTYSPEHGGPVRRDETSREMPATYKGSVDGDTMQLQIELSDKTLQPPPLTLKRRARGRVFKCR
jgi:hypothetical protein